MPVSGLALVASTGLRVASLNLCTDEYLLLLADPQQIVSVSYLSRLPEESVLWRQAQGFPANNGSLESVVPYRPNLILTMGRGGRASGLIAARLGIKVIDLPYPRTTADVLAQAATVAKALGTLGAYKQWQRRIVGLRQTAPQQAKAAVFVSGGGATLDPNSLGAEWLRLAGFRQQSIAGGRLTYETLLTRPPTWLIRSNYRAGQASRNARWFDHPVVRRLQQRTMITDGRAWTCAGLPMVAEVMRLRQARP